MTRKEDLEGHIRESYSLIREYEEIARTSDRPKEKARARHSIREQWGLVQEHLREYSSLCQCADLAMPSDIREIASRFEASGDETGSLDAMQSLPGSGSNVSRTGAAGTDSEARDWNTAAIRDLLSAAFSDGELTILCFDYFRAVYEDFGTGMGKGQKIQRLLDHCVRRQKLGELLRMVSEHNPAKYARFVDHLRK